MSDIVYAYFWRRGPGTTFTLRAFYLPVAAEGTQLVNGIGSGKVVIPAYGDMRRVINERVTMGDVCVAYAMAPNGTTPQLIATFIVQTKQYREGNYEISGPDFLGELEDYVAIAPIGEETTVTTTAVSMGDYLDRAPNPDVWVPLEAAYPSRGYFTQDVTPAGDINVLFTAHMAVQVTDTFRHTFADGDIFETKIVGVSDERRRVEIEDPLPQDLPGGSKVDFLSTRLRVADAAILAEGSQVFYTPSPYGTSQPRPAGSFIIDRIELGDGNAPDYIYSADPILDHILAGVTIEQKQYTEPTTNDVNQLLTTSTFGEWTLLRGSSATAGTAYAPRAETVYDVLLAIADMTGYHFRRYFRGWASQLLAETTAPLRKIEYFKPGSPPVTGQVTTLGTQNRVAANYGELLSLESDNANQQVTHVIPYGGGGGSGRFDFRTANIGTVLEDYEGLSWGVVGGQYYVYNTTLLAAGGRAVWTVETFNSISPANPANFESRREAAELLLRAACDFLIANQAVDTTYSADIYTLGEPLPGDAVSLTWAGVEPDTISEIKLIITDVHHTIDPNTPYRITTLTMNKNGIPRKDGAMSVAHGMLGFQRSMRHSNFGSGGDARIAYDLVEFGGEGRVTSRTGNITLQSQTADVAITADQGDVTIAGQNVTITGQVQFQGGLSMRTLVLQDATASLDYEIEPFTLRGIPRLRIRRTERAGS